MSGSVNKVTLIGNLGRDPEVKSFQNGDRMAQLRIATSETWKDRQSGEKRERVEWHSVAVHIPGLVALCERYLRKGGKVYVEGQLRTRKWQDQSGQDRYTTEVALQGLRAQLVMLDGADRRGGDGAAGGQAGGSAGGPAAPPPADPFDPGLDDDVPF